MSKETEDSQLKLMLGATGVVFGDIGTSPLYAFRESFAGEHKIPVDEFHVLGVLSMLFWALILVVTIKYVFVTMRADNRGEGGSFALLSLVRRAAGSSPAVPYVGAAALLATALFYGDAVITPAISILSAVEGLKLLDPGFEAFVVPITLAIVVVLFAIQRFGTGVVGALFGPVMLVWFLTIAGLGAWRMLENPSVLAAISPTYAVGYLAKDPLQAFFTLGSVVLAVTGAEALYADMGHFGRKPISRAWIILALPALALCYAGQAAHVMAEPEAIEKSFYALAPSWGLVPLILLAAVATVIASQSILSGAFSITQQAIQLGYLPRLGIRFTSKTERGQVFSPLVNSLLFIAVVAFVLGFQSSNALAAAYGIAVTATMVLTTLMMGFVIFRIWKWNPLWAGPLFLLILMVDVGLFSASATKIHDGGWIPLTIAAVLVVIFTTWRRGSEILREQLAADAPPIEKFIEECQEARRVPATAVYLTSDKKGVPHALIDNLKYNLVIHERVFIVTVDTELEPRVTKDKIAVEELGKGFTRVLIRYGFAESPNIPRELDKVMEDEKSDPLTAVYFMSRQTLVPTKRPGLFKWRDKLYRGLARFAERPMTFFKLPMDRVVEIGSQVKLEEKA